MDSKFHGKKYYIDLLNIGEFQWFEKLVDDEVYLKDEDYDLLDSTDHYTVYFKKDIRYFTNQQRNALKKVRYKIYRMRYDHKK